MFCHLKLYKMMQYEFHATQNNVMLCFGVKCYVMLCHVMSCYVMLCYVMLCYVMLCYIMLYYFMISSVPIFDVILFWISSYNYYQLCTIYDRLKNNLQLITRKIEYNIIILLAALSVNKPSDALRTVYFDKALEIIQMEEYGSWNEDETGSSNNGKIKIEYAIVFCYFYANINPILDISLQNIASSRLICIHFD